MDFDIISGLSDLRTIASGAGLRERRRLVRAYGPGWWTKRAGDALVRMRDGSIRRAELHWYESHGIGRREIKIRRFLDL
jgi:hypothetical protein